ncbi:hypothetical protein AAFA95_001245 [Enterococcus faecalis]|jgi:hypothetical protein|uniref:hypothetical protein n=1 Tax=Enterococcus faecalis TaxID=1351 RepID=UPI0006699B47|nr:hypothetical protein [Enterococcus faecalis]AMR96352.1 hypothetical protein A3777_12235 [Enterococcus faecalis]UKV07928.1 hypothetical protein L5I20_12115 [Enterococcus faecalis]HAP2760882.1 hypothetical protein [Enterococcus faecalis]HAP2909401.1 hypothetical protein [Enterococcus faecalis]HAP5697782.1 hypothetical protein [Enterococcus faecalis]
MRLYLSSIENKEKPKAILVKAISATILEELVDISMEEFAEEIAINGKTAVLAELTEHKLSKQTAIIGQELVMLDFDNKDMNNIYTIEDLEADTFMLDNACFIYRTFSDRNSQVDKFRVVFHLDKLVTENYEIEHIYQELFKKYPQADSSVGQTSRLFFGSNSGYEVIDWVNRLDTTKLAEVRNTDISKEVKAISGEMIDDSIPNYELLKLGRFDIVKEKLGNNFAGDFPDGIVAGNYFKSLDMRELLELPEGNPFMDIFHEEENPSASVFLNTEYDIYLYKCFSKTSPFQGDIIRVVGKLLGLNSYTKIVEVLINITNSNISWNSEIGEARLNALELQKALEKNTLNLNFPELNTYLSRYRREISILLDLIFDYTYVDKQTGEVKYMNFLSIKSYTKLVKDNLGYNISEGKMWNILNVVTVTELIHKVETNKIPKGIFDDLIDKQKKDSEQIRTSNVYIPTIDIQNAQAIAEKMVQNRVTISGLGYELVYRLFGEEKAKRDFPQAYTPLEEKGLITMSKQNKNLPKSSVALEKAAVKILVTELETKGYIFESELISKLAKNRRMKLMDTKKRFEKIRADIYNKYDISRERLTKDLYRDLGIVEKYSPKVILFRRE